MDYEQTIQHLGGYGPLRAMVNARAFAHGPNTLSFKFSGYRKANLAMVTLTGLDLYDLALWKVPSGPGKAVATVTGLYADNLREAFERMTGLRLVLVG